MRTKEIEVRLGYKVNMGNFETLDISYSITAELEAGDDREEAFAKLYGWTEQKVGEEIAKARSASRVSTVRKSGGKTV